MAPFRCGGNIGIFMNLRKCVILYLHDGNGSFSNAPYLDKHGEVDPGLRRNRQLVLNQKRYDALLRHLWLHHVGGRYQQWWLGDIVTLAELGRFSRERGNRAIRSSGSI